MAIGRMTTKQIADLLLTALRAFVALAGGWIVLDLLADIANSGLLGSLAAIAFLLALVAMAAVLLIATSLLIE